MFGVRKKLIDDESIVSSEWHSLPSVTPSNRNKIGDCTISLKYPEKNRYVDVLAIDKTRVIIPATDNNTDGYINANYIQLPNSKVIATQAPLSNTIDEFWMMVWENRVRVIVMLTKLTERRKVKANCYWPSEGNINQYGKISVHSKKVKLCDNFIIRRFTISNGESNRKIYQIQYTSWPDFGVPDSSSSIIELLHNVDLQLERLHVKRSKKRVRVLCHCSAGIGRCGTLLAIQSAIEKILSGTPITNVNISQIVSELRTQRSGIVQTKDQYSFVYKVVNDYIKASEQKSGRIRRTKNPLRSSPKKLSTSRDKIRSAGTIL